VSIYERIIGTIRRVFSIGLAGPKVAWDASADPSADRMKVLRGDQDDPTSTVYARLAGADPAANQDFVTREYGRVNHGPPAIMSLDILGELDVLDLPSNLSNEVVLNARKIVTVKATRRVAGSSGTTTVVIQKNGSDTTASFSWIPSDGNESTKTEVVDIDIEVDDVIRLMVTSVEVGGDTVLVRLQ